MAQRATPHTRGSTGYHVLCEGTIYGYPAYAGIDPRRILVIETLVRLPRIRGDRPRDLSVEEEQR